VYEDEPRAAAILQRSKGQFDVLGFTEVWADTMRDRFAKKLAPDYKSYIPQVTDVKSGSPNQFKQLLNEATRAIKQELSGSPAMTLSVKGEWVYGPSFDYYLNMEGYDSAAFKGVSFGVARVNGTLVGLVQTHTQASYTGTEVKDGKARDLQIQQTLFPAITNVQNWLTSQGSKGPIVLLGDLNIVAETDEYKWLSEQLGQMGFQDCWTKNNPGHPGYTYVPADNPLVTHWDKTQKQPQRLDYIFLAPRGSGAQCQEMKVLTDWRIPVSGNSIDLSDHYPVSATIGLTYEHIELRDITCSRDEDCLGSQCARKNAGVDTLICCPSNKSSTYAGFSYCSGMPDGNACWSDAMCAGGLCTGNAEGVKKGTCMTPTPIGTSCVHNNQCASGACGYAQAGDSSHVCCASGVATFGGNDYCNQMPAGSACWSDAMCANGTCKGNWGGIKKGTCN